jgi:hypothetical protein
MRGAFVVQLWNADRGSADGMGGVVEEVDSGKQSQFRSEQELTRFLRERFAEACRRSSGKGEAN